MHKLTSDILGLCFIMAIFIQCKPDAAPAKDVNPNGSSELAVLMRDMYDDGMRMKEDVMAGRQTKVECDYMRIHTAIATDPEEMTTENFKAYSAAYQTAVEELNAAPAGEQAEEYTHMVNTCIQCHHEFCSGPIRRIKKMELPKDNQ